MKKAFAIVIVGMIIFSIFPNFTPKTRGEECSSYERSASILDNRRTVVDSCGNFSFDLTKAEALPVITTENVSMLDDGRSLVKLMTVVPSSPLADIYRESLGSLTTMDGDSRIPASKTQISDAVGSVTEFAVFNRESFCRGIEQEQSFSLGRILEIFDYKVEPRDGNDDFRVSLSAFASPQVVNSTDVGSDTMREIGIGLMDHEATSALAGFVFSKITFVQMMLRSLEGRQVYDYTWITRISLPLNGILLNRDKLDGLNWEMDFGRGTCMDASVSVDETSTVIVNERTLVSERDITAKPDLLLGGFSTYKTFKLKYLLPRSAPTHSETPTSEDTWEKTWPCPSWSNSTQLSFSEGPIIATLTVATSLTISVYVGWNLDFGGLNWFEAWMSVAASINVEFEATTTASYSHPFQNTLFEWKTRYYFSVGWVPVWADLQFTSNASLTISAYAKISFYAQAEAQATFKAGVRWARDSDWSGISEVTPSASKTGPNISAEAGASVRPAIQFRLAFLFYGVAGPFVECEIYVNAAITYVLPNGSWEVSVNFRIIAGSTFVGWLKTLLGLDDWSTVIYERRLASWSGAWGPSSISITETLDPSTTPPSGSVQVYGTATLNDGRLISRTDVVITVIETGESWTTTTNNEGDYSANITAAETADLYTVRVSIASGSLSGSNSKTMTVDGLSGIGSHYQLYGTTTCKGVEPNDPYDPINETEVFRTSDSDAYVWVHLANVNKELWVKWEFFDPNNNSYWLAEHRVPDQSGGWYKCWDNIYIQGHQAEDMEGRWRCRVCIDEGGGYEIKAIEEFVIRYEIVSAYRTMAKDVLGGVQNPTFPYDPIDPTNKFLNTEPRALGWIRLDELAESIDVKWEWREPSGNIDFTWYNTSKDPADEGYLYYEWYKFWGWINIFGTSRQSKLGLWEVRAYIKDVYGNWDLEYSEYFTISDNTPPGTPGTPVVDDGTCSTFGNVTWTWTAAPEDGAVVQYQIQVGTALGGNDVYDSYTGTSLNKTLSSLASGHTYYARVRAMNQPGQWGPWSNVSDGITVDRPPMTLITSKPEETVQDGNAFFSWIGSDDVTQTSNLVYSYCLTGYDLNWSLFTSNTSRQYNNLPDSNYTFKVQAKDSLGSADQTPAEVSFTALRAHVRNTNTSLNYATIQAAIDAPETLDGHTIKVDAGNFSENIVVNKAISLVGASEEDTIIDGGGHTVINIMSSNATIKLLIIRNGWSGIYANGVHGIRITDNIITSNVGTGIGDGIYLVETHDSIISRNAIFNNTEDGITLAQNCNNNVVSGNQIISNGGNGVIMHDHADRNIISFNNISLNNANGICMANVFYDKVVAGNNIANNNNDGILLYNSSNNILSENSVVNSRCEGIYLGGSSNSNTLSVNNATDNGYAGIKLDMSSNNTLLGNCVAGNGGDGIILYGSSNNGLSENNIANNHWNGIFLCGTSDGNLLYMNNVTNATHTGIELDVCFNNTLLGNHVTYNTGWAGISIYDSLGNNITHNSFGNNRLQIHVRNSTSIWDNGYSSGGNYWSDYVGLDLYSGPYQNETNGDGIGDVPYVVDAENKDHYPLIHSPGELIGDLNGDGYVRIDEILAIATHFGQEQEEPGYSRIFDIYCDGYIGIDDIFMAASHFRKEDPRISSAQEHWHICLEPPAFPSSPRAEQDFVLRITSCLFSTLRSNEYAPAPLSLSRGFVPCA